MRLIVEVIELIFPSNIYCIGCGAIIDRTRPYALCDLCIEEFRFASSRVCEKCGKVLADDNVHKVCRDCLVSERKFYKGYSCMTYGNKEKKPILSLKYGNKSYVGRKLGELLYDRLEPECLEIDYIIAVPLAKQRARERGYNQAEIIARDLSARMKVRYLNAIQRTKNTKPMSGLSREEREGNLKNVFTIPEQFSKIIEGSKVLLIDDIFTTGSTADACSEELLKAGAKQVYFASIASGADMIMKN